jgi:uncharacterized phage-associated protein
MHFRFHFEKTLQAAGVLLGFAKDRMEYMRLLKLLYIADRELLAETGRTITGDHVVAMKHGPVLSRVYDIIKGESARSSEWAEYIRTDHKDIERRQTIKRDLLTRAEVEKLLEVSERHADDTVWDICDKTHDFEEWKKTYTPGTSIPIPWDEVLNAQGKGHFVESAEKDEDLRRCLDELFGT